MIWWSWMRPATLAAAEANEHALITAETRRLCIAAHWADLHPGDAIAQSLLPGIEHPVRLGGEGTPTVAGFAPAELGCVLRISDGAACRLIGDALDLRHRLRLIWAAAEAGQVPAYQARHIATATRHLTAEQAGWVDTQLASSLGAVSWGRLQTLLEAKIIEADPVGAEQQAALAAQQRFVRLGRSSEHGLKLIIARANAGDAIWFKATIDRIADILARQGDTDPVEVRRSKAIGILAQPAQALELLCHHQDGHWDGPAEPADPPYDPEDGDVDGSVEIADQTLSSRLSRQSSRSCRRRAERADLDRANAPAEEGAHRSLQLTPPPFDPDRARPRAVIYVHLSAEALSGGSGVARVEEVGPVLLCRLRFLLGDRCGISLKPVIDLPAGHIPVDSYEIPTRLREQLQLRYPADVFPYAAAVSRRIDVDHTIAYLSTDKGRPPGQTRIGNLGPHVRRHHNYKTLGAGRFGSPNPAPGCGDHPTAGSTWSTPLEPIPSAILSSLKRCGARPGRHNNRCPNLLFRAPIERFIRRSGATCRDGHALPLQGDLLSSRLQRLLRSWCANCQLRRHSFHRHRIRGQRLQVPDKGVSRFSVVVAAEVVVATLDPGGCERVVAQHGVERIIQGRQVPLDDVRRAAGGESGSEDISLVAGGNHRERLERVHEVRDDPRHIGHHGVRSVGQLSKRRVGCRRVPTMRP